MPRLPVQNIAGLSPLIDPVRTTEPFVIAGRNFIITPDGIAEAYVYDNLIALEDNFKAADGVQSIRTSDGTTFICAQNAIFCYNPLERSLFPAIWFDETDTVYPWTYGRVGRQDFFARRGVGLVSVDRDTKRWRHEVSESDIYSCTEIDGRLFIVAEGRVEWSKIGNGRDRATSTTTGAGFHTLPNEASVCFSYGRGVVTYTESGMWRSELTQGVIPFRHFPFHGKEFTPLNPLCVVPWVNDTHLFFTREGFYTTDGVNAPREFEVLFGEYLVNEVQRIGALDFNYSIRLMSSVTARRLYVSVASQGFAPGIFLRAFVYDALSQQWGNVQQVHKGILEFVYDNNHLDGLNPGFVSSLGDLYLFPSTDINHDYRAWLQQNEDSFIFDLRDSSPHPTYETIENDNVVLNGVADGQAFGDVDEHTPDVAGVYEFTPPHGADSYSRLQAQVDRNAFIEIGPFRAVTDEYIDQLSELSEIYLVSGKAERQDSEEDFLHDYPVDIYEDYLVLADELSEDYGVGVDESVPPKIRVRTTLDGEIPWFIVEPIIREKTLHGKAVQQVLHTTGLFHNILFESDNDHGLFTVKLLELDLLQAGRL